MNLQRTRTESRRSFLTKTAAGSLLFGSGALAIAANPSGEKMSPGYIDAHSHIWTPAIDKYPLGKWTSKDRLSPPSFTAEELLKIAGANGVSRVVLIQHAPYYGYDNSYLIDSAKRYPGSFSIVGMINERLPDLPKRLAALREKGIRGIRIGPTKHADRTLNIDPPRWLEAKGMQTLWKTCADQNVAVCPLLGPDHLATLDPMCTKYPETKCVIDHFGHATIEDTDAIANLTKLARHKNVLVKVSALYKFGDKKAPYEDVAPLIKQVFEAFGPQRLMWASDCPYQLLHGNNYTDSISLFAKGLPFLNDSDRQAILCKTAESVFFVD